MVFPKIVGAAEPRGVMTVLRKQSVPARVHSIGQRSELYNFLDNLPIEDLLQLRVPLEWVLKVMREKK